MAAARIVAFSGSLREGSYNQKLVRIAATGAEMAGAEVTVLDLRDAGLPLYSADLEAAGGIPEPVRRFKDTLIAAQGLLIASPENNSSLSAALKNAIDWATRPGSKDEPPLAAFRGKVAGIMAASPGALGGLRGLADLRKILHSLHVIVVTEQRSISAAHEAFDGDGRLRNPKDQEAIEAIGARVADLATRLAPAG